MINAALEAETDTHLGRFHGTPAEDGNHRNGTVAKTLATEIVDVENATPCDRVGSFEPQLVAKRQTRLAGLDDRIIGLYAGDMSVREISIQLSELYGTEIGRDQVSRSPTRCSRKWPSGATGPLDELYVIVCLDALVVKVRTDRSVANRSCYLTIGVTSATNPLGVGPGEACPDAPCRSAL